MLLKKRRGGGPLDEPFPPEEESPFDDPPQPERKRWRLPFGKKEPELDLTPIEAGATTIQDILSPTSVDLFGRDYVVVDGVYHAYLYITGYGYSTVVGAGWLAPLVEAGEGVSLSFTVKRQPKDKILPKIAQTTMVNRSRMRDVGDTRQDYEELDSAIASGLYLKDAMNRQGEDFYYMHTLIEVTAEDPDTLEQRVAAVETLCTSIDIIAKRCDFKHEQGFLSSLPLLYLDPDIERKSRRNALTSGVAAAFPFASFEICDRGGIFLGIDQHNRSAVVLNFFDDTKYSSGNTCILGSTGVGKTHLIQTVAMRLREQQKRVIIVAPFKGFEYRAACELVGGAYAKLAPSSTDCINVLEIRRVTLDADAELGERAVRLDSLLADKIARVIIFYSLLKKDITEEDKNYLDASLMELYGRYGITFDNESVFDGEGTIKPMPTLAEWYEVLNASDTTRHLAVVLSRFATGSASRMGGRTNVDLNNPYIVIDTSDAPKELRAAITYIATDASNDISRRSRVEPIALIYDEVWVLIGAMSNPQAAETVLETVKTIRGYGGICITATQDLIDYFSLDDGKYGKGILNNSRIKIVMQMEEEEARLVQKHMGLSDDEVMQVIRSQRGEGLLCAGRNRIAVSFQASQKEHDAITTSLTDLLARKERQEEAGAGA